MFRRSATLRSPLRKEPARFFLKSSPSSSIPNFTCRHSSSITSLSLCSRPPRPRHRVHGKSPHLSPLFFFLIRARSLPLLMPWSPPRHRLVVGRSVVSVQAFFFFADPVAEKRAANLLDPVRSEPATAGAKPGSVKDRTGPDQRPP